MPQYFKVGAQSSAEVSTAARVDVNPRPVCTLHAAFRCSASESLFHCNSRKCTNPQAVDQPQLTLAYPNQLNNKCGHGKQLRSNQQGEEMRGRLYWTGQEVESS
ncbi:hypothetical protein NQZ68_004875 [Dissostichus eleginoides]|nr:hypothetical protein NQZ68_004875 [Dissostichus eleginoides]